MVAFFAAQHMVLCLSQLQHGSVHHALVGLSVQYPQVPKLHCSTRVSLLRSMVCQSHCDCKRKVSVFRNVCE